MKLSNLRDNDALKLALVVPIIIGFIIYVKVYQHRQDNRYNQFINSPEGKALTIHYLFHFEGIDGQLFEAYSRSKKASLSNRNLELDYRVEVVLQYALKEFQSVPPDKRENFLTIVRNSPEIKIGDVFYEEYQASDSLSEKVAVVKFLIELNSEFWDR